MKANCPATLFQSVFETTVRRSRCLVAWLAGRSPRTLRAYAGDLDHFARFAGAGSGGHAVDLLLGMSHGQANACVLAYRNAMTDGGLAAATIARRLAALRSVVKCARTSGP